MTDRQPLQEARPITVRAVVEGEDRLGVRVADEYQSFEYATRPQKLKLKAGEVVELSRRGRRYEIERVLPYHSVDQVRHPDIPGLSGVPLVNIGHPGIFTARGRTYLREGETAHDYVQRWRFETESDEAAYVSSVLMGARELPGVQLSRGLLQRLQALGMDERGLQNLQEAQTTLQNLQAHLETATTKAADEQTRLHNVVAELTSQQQAREQQIQTLLDGITEAEAERDRVMAEKANAAREAKGLVNQAKKDAKALQDKAKKEKTDAENLMGQALKDKEKLAERSAELRRLLERPEQLQSGRQELLDRKPHGPDDEISALQSAFDHLKLVRGTTPAQLIGLHVGLKHTPFTVLVGPSGSGKTSLALAYAQQLGIHVTTVAVQPGWTSVQDLHGYVNPLQPEVYRSTPFFEALGHQVRQSRLAEVDALSASEPRAGQGALVPLDLVLLDEINLSHVEYFLADYLSAFELERRTVALTTPDEARRLALDEKGNATGAHPLAWLRECHGQLDVPRSFLIAGTANEDDTTRAFSDKFRDRSTFLHIEAPPLKPLTLNNPKDVKDGRKYVPRHTWEAWLENSSKADMSQRLIDFSEALRAARLPISVRLFQRTARMSGDARRLLEALEVPDAPRVALDLAVSLGIAHKYAQLTAGRSQETQREDFKEALQTLLGGHHQATEQALGWPVDG